MSQPPVAAASVAKMAAVMLSLCALCSATVCPYQECTCTQAKVDCRGLGLSELKLQASYDPGEGLQAGGPGWTLDVSNNNISHIGDHDLPSDIYMFISVDTPLVTLTDHAFSLSTHSLDIVHVRNSSLSTVPPAITSLQNLTTLVWTHHDMPRLPDLTSMTSLTHLGLWTNQIISSPDDVLPTGLDTLHLHDNNLTVLPQSLTDLDRLTLLSIGDNNIRSLNSVTLPYSLLYLGVNDNLISEMSALTFTVTPPQLATFNLSGNPLREVGEHALSNLVNLHTLDVSGTRLLRLPSSVMTLTSLQKVTARRMRDLLCDCGDQALGVWLSKSPGLTLDGDCMGSDLQTTLSYLSQFCPPVVG